MRSLTLRKLLLGLLLAGIVFWTPRITKGQGQDKLKGKIVFAGQTVALPATYEIFSINADGTGKKQLTHDGALGWSPACSPNGTKIAFVSNKDSDVYHVYVMNVDGSEATQLTDQDERPSGLAWSPDGKKIAFTSRRDGNIEIYVMNADGTKPMNLTKNPADDVYPSWSPDGKLILFSTLRDDRSKTPFRWQNYAMNVNGASLRSISRDLASTHAYPRWSPDGKRIAEVWIKYAQDGSVMEGNINIFTLTGAANKLLPYSGTYDSPSWSPDGKYLVMTHRVFDADNSVRKELVIVGVDTIERYPLVTEGNAEVANWCPLQ